MKLTGLRTADLASLSKLTGKVAEKSSVCLGRTDAVTVIMTCTDECSLARVKYSANQVGLPSVTLPPYSPA